MSSIPPPPLSTWARAIAPSPTLAVDAKAKALLAAGEDVCGFAAGEPDFDTPRHIKDACIAALESGKTKYGPTPGMEPLRAAIAARYGEEYGLKVAPGQVVVSPGGKFSCYLAVLATCSPGDEVIIPAPYWVSYPEMAKLAGAAPKPLLATDATGFKITPAQLESAVTPRSRMLILNSPSNPTGAVYSRAELEAIMEVAVRRNLYVLSDEMYEHLLYDGARATCVATFGPEAAARSIVVAGFSKTYAMTGWRLGTLVAPAPIAKAVSELQSQMTSNANTFAQYGALAALTEKAKTRAALDTMLVAFDRRRRFLHGALTKIPGVSCMLSQGAFYLFPNIDSFGLSSLEFSERLLEREKVAVVPGSAFGAEGYVRMSYATSDEIIAKGVARMANFCRSITRSAVPAALAVMLALSASRLPAQEADTAENNRALRLLTKIPMPQMSGTWDHLSADAATSRLFLSAQEDHAVDVVDLRKGRPILRIVGSFNRPQGECYVPGLNKLVITNGRDGTCRIISGESYEVLDSVQLSLGADMIEFDPRSKYLYIDHGGNDSKRGPGYLAVVDAASDKLIGNIETDFRPAAMALETAGPRIFVILPGKNQVAVIDRTTREIIGRYPVGGRPASMTFDEGHRRLFVPTRTIPGTNPGQSLFVLDADSGKVVATVPCMDGIESMFYDASLRRLYVTGLQGFAEVYQQADPDDYKSIAKIPTGPGAGTSQFIPGINRYCVALSPHDKQVSQIWVFEPIP